jgi:hypothetical protein
LRSIALTAGSLTNPFDWEISLAIRAMLTVLGFGCLILTFQFDLDFV